jgi:hypothetical protein
MIYGLKISKIIFLAFVSIFIIFTLSCGGLRSARTGEGLAKFTDTPLDNSYHKIIIQKFEIDPNVEKDYPEATSACESTAMKELLRKSSISQIVKVNSSSSREHGALIIKTRISTLRLVSIAARSWGGALAGSSEMAVNLKLIDAASGQTLREKNISTANNAYAASPAGGSSDRSLPYDLGKMIADYIADVVSSR